MDFKSLADLIVDYSLNIQTSDKVLLIASKDICDFLKVLTKKILDKKACVDWHLKDENLDEVLYHYGNNHQISFLPSYKIKRFKDFSIVVSFMSINNLYYNDIKSKDIQDSFYKIQSKLYKQVDTQIKLNKLKI